MDYIPLIISLISGALGGNISGATAPDKSLGALGNTIAGLIGGGGGAWIAQALGLITQVASHMQGASTGTEHLDVGSIISSIISGGAGGGILTYIAGLIKNAVQKT